MLITRNKNESIKVHIDGKDITNCRELKLLGVTVDSDLTFKSHIREICKKASNKIGVISRLKNLISTKTKLHIYKYAILPNLTYCHTVWHFCTKTDRNKLERIQERALRIVFKEKAATYDELLKKAGLTTLYNL